MAVVLVQWSLCVIAVNHLTSSQPTHDVDQTDTDVDSCSFTQQTVNHLVSVVSQLQRDVTDLKATVANTCKQRTGRR